MRNGFFIEREELRKFYEGCGFSFLDVDEFLGHTAYDFLHGYCEVFSVFLHKKYGWPIRKAYADGKLVHAFCSAGELLVDVRGATNSKKEFWEEFSILLFGFSEKSDYENILIKDASKAWIDKMWSKRNGEKKELFVSAEEIDKRYDFWHELVAREKAPFSSP